MIFLALVASSCTVLNNKEKKALWWFLIILCVFIETWQISDFVIKIIEFYWG